MSDYISRADVFEIIDKAFSQPMRNGVTLYADICLMLNALPTHANSRSTHERDYISRADAIVAVASITMSIHLSNVICDKLSALPSADAVSREDTVTLNSPISIQAEMVAVVRCKDCKHWHSNTEFCGIWSFQNIAQRTLSDDYCSRAERKEE